MDECGKENPKKKRVKRLMEATYIGRILGLLLFLIFMNDLPGVVEECTINLYADDTTIYSADSSMV